MLELIQQRELVSSVDILGLRGQPRFHKRCDDQSCIHYECD